MSSELKQAAQQALDAFEAFGEADDFATLFTLAQKMNALHTAIQQAESEPVTQWQKCHPVRTNGKWENTDEHDAKWWLEHSRGWEIRALYTHPAPGVPDDVVRDAERWRDLVRRHGRELMDLSGYATELDATKSTAAIAWGWLWHVTTADDRVKAARHLLGQMLDKDLKRYGIQTAKAEGAQVNVQEIEAAMLRGDFGNA